MAFIVSKGKDPSGNYVAYIDPTKPENEGTYPLRGEIGRLGAKFRFVNGRKVWLWYLGKTPEQWNNVFNKVIEPALRKLHAMHGSSDEDSKNAIIQSIEKIRGEIERMPMGSGITEDEKNDVTRRLDEFKNKLINIESLEEFKNTMRILVRFKNAQGHKMSLGNALLVMIQDPKATIVMGASRWNDPYGRKIKAGSPHVLVKAPIPAPTKRKRGDLAKKKEEYAKKNGYKSYVEMPPGMQDKFNVASRGQNIIGFRLVPNYDIRFTEPIEGREDKAKDLEAKAEIKWYDEDQLSEEVRPVYGGLMEFAKSAGIDVDMAGEEDLGGARGYSAGGKIRILNNEGNDVGITKTLCHEIAHELLHQKYLSDKKSDLSQYFVGQEAGREIVEQQAEITAWAVMTAYGFDLDIASMNYAIMWGAKDADSMVKVFDGVTGVINRLIDEINKYKEQTQNEGQIHEDDVENKKASFITPDQLADKLGMGGMYQKAKKHVAMKEQFRENFYRKVGYIIKG